MRSVEELRPLQEDLRSVEEDLRSVEDLRSLEEDLRHVEERPVESRPGVCKRCPARVKLPRRFILCLRL